MGARGTRPSAAGGRTGCAAGLIITIAVLLTSLLRGASAARKPADWARMTDAEWEVVAAQWDEEDDPEERKEEGQFEYERMMRAKEQGLPAGVDLNDPDEYFAASQSLGHTMMFANIHKEHDIKALAYRWREQLFLAGIEVTCYDVDEHTLLITLQRGWNGIQLKDFLVDQVEVADVKWQEKEFRGKHAAAAKKRRTRRRGKGKKGKQGKKSKKNQKKGEKQGKTTQPPPPPPPPPPPQQQQQEKELQEL